MSARLYRAPLPLRLWHWANALAVICLTMSGLMIFNAHPRLYWGAAGANADPAWLEIGHIGARGFVRVGALMLPGGGVLGYAGGRARAFPGWLTIPTSYSLADARVWHFFFAWVLVLAGAAFAAWAFASGHVRRELWPRRGELAPRHLAHEIAAHARLRFPGGAAAAEYNTLQKLAYLAVLGLLLPLMVLTGLAMSPALDAGWPWLLVLTGGRQSARSLHFLGMAALAGFTAVHLAMLLAAGPLPRLRAMLTGWLVLAPERGG